MWNMLTLLRLTVFNVHANVLFFKTNIFSKYVSRKNSLVYPHLLAQTDGAYYSRDDKSVMSSRTQPLPQLAVNWHNVRSLVSTKNDKSMYLRNRVK